MNRTPKKKEISLNTKRGAQTFLRDLKKEIPNKLKRYEKSQIQGFKSKHYHLRRIKEFEKGLMSDNKKIVKETIKKIQKYATRQGEHKKVVDVKKTKKKVIYYKEWKPRGHLTRHGKGITSITTFYEFVMNWDYIKLTLSSFGAQNTPLNVFLYGIGRTYEAWREKVSRALGISPDELIKWLNWAKEIYLFRRQDFNTTINYIEEYYNLAQDAYINEEWEIAEDAEKTINYFWKSIIYWYNLYDIPNNPKPKYGQGTETVFLDFVAIAFGVGRNIVEIFKWL